MCGGCSILLHICSIIVAAAGDIRTLYTNNLAFRGNIISITEIDEMGVRYIRYHVAEHYCKAAAQLQHIVSIAAYFTNIVLLWTLYVEMLLQCCSKCAAVHQMSC